MKVVDASVGFKWVVTEHDSDRAIALQSEDLIAPDLFCVEVTNALRSAELRGRISDTQTLLDDLFLQLPDLRNSIPLLPRALEIALQAHRSVYDALYVALAEQENCELVTADEKLYNSLKSQFPFIAQL